MKDNSSLYEEGKEKAILLSGKVDFCSQLFPQSEAENSIRTASYLRIFSFKISRKTCYILVGGGA